MADRVVVFLDYQNVYSGAREAFHRAGDPGWCGQVDPERLGQYLARGIARLTDDSRRSGSIAERRSVIGTPADS